MPPRRRKFSSANATMRRRMGLTSWGNSRPFLEWSKSLTTRTLGEGHNSGSTTGAIFILPVNNWNDPLGTLSNLVAGSGSLTSNRHPIDHDSAIASGYERVQVLGWKLEIDVNWIGGASNVMDYVVGYTFGQDLASEVTLTAGTAARIERMEFESNRRWTLKHYNANPGQVTGAKRNSKIVVNVPNVFKYCDIIARGTDEVEANNATVSHQIADVNSLTNPPEVALFCTVVIYTESGLALPVDSVHVTLAVTQRVKIMRDKLGAEDMDDGEADVHA